MILSFTISGACMLAALVYSVSGLGVMHRMEEDIARNDLVAATTIISLLLIGSFIMISLGVIGEYIGAIWTQVKNKPLVIEDERINFD